MMKTLLLSLCFCVLLASGCASRGPVGSFAGPLPEQNTVAAIAGDAVSILAGLYPPGHTTLAVLPAKDAENGFALALDSGLRAKGFTLSAPDSSGSVSVAYTLDMLEDKAAWYLRLRLTDGKDVRAIARAYDAHGQPEAGQSRMVVESSSMLDAAKERAGKAVDAARDLLSR